MAGRFRNIQSLRSRRREVAQEIATQTWRVSAEGLGSLTVGLEPIPLI